MHASTFNVRNLRDPGGRLFKSSHLFLERMNCESHNEYDNLSSRQEVGQSRSTEETG